MSLNVITRGDWGALPPKKLEPLEHPVPYICLSYNNKVKEHSPELIRSIQKTHMDSSMDDIQSNFLIALDGTVYEGRGWLAQPAKLYEKYEKYNGKFLDITLLGEFKEEVTIEHPIYTPLTTLIHDGIENKMISSDFEFVMDPENETLIRALPI